MTALLAPASPNGLHKLARQGLKVVHPDKISDAKLRADKKARLAAEILMKVSTLTSSQKEITKSASTTEPECLISATKIGDRLFSNIARRQIERRRLAAIRAQVASLRQAALFEWSKQVKLAISLADMDIELKNHLAGAQEQTF